MKIFGIETNFISVLFIFDLKTQEKGQYLLGTKLCEEIMIDSYLFSFEDCSLYELYNEDNKNNNLIKVNDYFPSFVINEDRRKENYPINLNKKKKKKSNDRNNKITNFFHYK